MKTLKLDYYNGDIYEKYKINNILLLLVDKHKLQNETFDFNDLSNKNNYSIIALLGSQIKNMNDDIYKNIETNDIIYAISELKKLDEQISINENRNSNYILDIAKELYYEYSQNGLIKPELNFNFNEKNFIDINLQLMKEINKEIENYENKVYNLHAYSDEEKRKRDSHSHRLSNTSSINPVKSIEENHLYYANKENNYNDNLKKLIQENNIYKNNLDTYIEKKSENDFREININNLKEENNNKDISNYEAYINLKKNRRNSLTKGKDELYEKYMHTNIDRISNQSNINYVNKEEISTKCNSNELINNEINYQNNNIAENKNMDIHNVSRYPYNLPNKSDSLKYLNNKIQYEKNEKPVGIDYYRNTVSDTIINSKINNEYIEKKKKSIYGDSLHENINTYNNIDKYEKHNSLLKNDINFDKKIDMFRRTVDNASVNKQNYQYENMPLKNNTSNIFNNNNTINIYSKVLDNIDKMEMQLVNNHLKKSLTHNEHVARRMSSILLNQNVNKNIFNKKPFMDKINKKYNSNSLKNYNSSDIISLNRYMNSMDQFNKYTSDTNNDNSLIISNINKHNSIDDSYKEMNDYDKYFTNNVRNNTTNNNNFNDFELNNNNNTNNFLNMGNNSNFSGKYRKSTESILNTYINKYSRALDINDLNSNTSKNYLNSVNSLKSDLTIKDNYTKMLERSKSLTSQIGKIPLNYKYLKANN